jgi:hypothetical protein
LLLERGGAEVLVHGVEAGEQVAEAVGPDRQHRRQPDRRVHRVAAADPVPEAEHVGGVDPELRHLSAFVETATKCFAIADSSPRRPRAQSRAVRAFVIVSSVVKVFDETMKSVSSAARSRVASAKSVESTFETKRKVRSRRV